MFIDRLLNQDGQPELQQMLRFTEARHRLIAQNVANVDVPGYKQKDLSLEKFQQVLAERSAVASGSAPGSVLFDDLGVDVENPQHGILFHDGQTRSMEQLMSDLAKNALMHNVVIELLRQQTQQMQSAIKLQP
jgi:flagellar basal-body rod protein FlgB